MNLAIGGSRLLKELCEQHGVRSDKVLRLLDVIGEYEFKDRRTDIHDVPREILKSKPASDPQRSRKATYVDRMRHLWFEEPLLFD